MYIFSHFGMHVATLIHSFILVFRFLGHLFYSFIDIISGRASVAWSDTIDFMYYAGVRPVIPLVFVCILIGISISQTVYFLLLPFHMHQKILPIVQNILTHEVLPIIIGFILCIQV